MDNKLDRRSLIVPTTAAAALGLGSLGKSEAAGEPSSSPHALLALAQLRDYRARRSSSYDRSGGNADSIPIDPGATATLLETTGAGAVTHIWFTINSREDFHLKKLVLRAYWDGEAEPSVEVPVGDFFGLGLGDYFLYQSALTSVAGQKALNAYFPMPFGTSARITVTNEGAVRTDNFYYNIDYVTFSHAPADVGYFHAQYRQAAPCRGWTDGWKFNWDPLVDKKKNLDGEGNYVFMEARGRGHFIGVTHAILQNQDGWLGEGDEMIFIDGETLPSINGTGTEDYYNGAWDFGQTFAYPHNGAPYMVDPERIGGRYCLYRWHTESPIAFQESIRVTIEHGHANHRSDNFFSSAFWYQTEPHQKFPALPKVADRIPRIYRVGGPGAA
jgi:hypothetical protein